MKSSLILSGVSVKKNIAPWDPRRAHSTFEDLSGPGKKTGNHESCVPLFKERKSVKA